MDGWGSRRVAVEFESEGAVLRGFLYEAVKGDPPFPVVVMTHGTPPQSRWSPTGMPKCSLRLGYRPSSMTIEIWGSAEASHARRSTLGCRDAITFASTIEYLDPARIGVWGDSYSAGQVFLVDACDSRVKVVVAQCPVIGADPPPGVDPTREVFEAIRETFESGDVSGGAGDKTGPMPVVSSDQLGTPSLLQPIQAFRWFIDYGGTHGSGWQNHATRINPSNTAPFSPYLCAP